MPLPPDPVAFVIPYLNREVYWYGIMVTLGTLVAAIVADREARRNGRNPDHIWNALILVMIFGLLGARLYHVLSAPAESGSNLASYLRDPISIIAFWNGGLRGLGVFGGVVGGLFGLWFYVWEHNRRYVTNFLRALISPFRRALRRTRLDPIRVPREDWLVFPEWADYVAVGAPLGQAIGRWGNYFNQELYGRPTTLPWGLPVAQAYRLPTLASLPEDARFHPTFVYESLWCLLVFFVLRFVAHHWSDKVRAGDILLLFLILYPLGRFVIEYQRPDAWTWAGVPVAQLVSVVSIAVASVWILLRHGVHRRSRAQEVATN